VDCRERVYVRDVSGLVSANGVVSVILEMDGGGNDVAFSSAEGPAAPELIVTAPPSGP
jgi:hypothetical protein